MLSHGGSRLNASKPEANPKTSCPIQKKKKETEISSFLFGLFVVYTKLLNWDSGMFVVFPLFSFVWQCTFVQKIPCLTLRASNFLMKANHVSPPIVRRYLRSNLFTSLAEKNTSNRIASQKNAAFRLPRRREVHEKFTRFFRFSPLEKVSVFVWIDYLFETSDIFKQEKTVACLTSLVYASFTWRSSKPIKKKTLQNFKFHTL